MLIELKFVFLNFILNIILWNQFFHNLCFYFILYLCYSSDILFHLGNCSGTKGSVIFVEGIIILMNKEINFNLIKKCRYGWRSWKFLSLISFWIGEDYSWSASFIFHCLPKWWICVGEISFELISPVNSAWTNFFCISLFSEMFFKNWMLILLNMKNIELKSNKGIYVEVFKYLLLN